MSTVDDLIFLNKKKRERDQLRRRKSQSLTRYDINPHPPAH